MRFPGWRRREREAEIQEELRFHLEEEAAERTERGAAEHEARRAAERELGNVALVQEDMRSAWTWMPMEQLLQDIRYGLRNMAANKTFSAMAILSLALGIGANTAIFSFMDSILLRSLPVPDPESLVILSWRTPQREMYGSNRHNNSFNDSNGGYIGGIFSYPGFEVLRKADSVFSSVFGYQGAGDLHVTIRGNAHLASTEYVSGDYFRGMGIAPAAGRLIVPDDDRPGAPGVAVITFAMSQERFGSAQAAAGQPIQINNQPFTVIGVTPPEFFGADPDRAPDVYVPLHANQVLQSRIYTPDLYLNPNFDWVVPMARLRPGVTAAQAQAALAGPYSEWARKERTKRKANNTPTLVVREGAGGLDGLRRVYSKPLYLLQTLVVLILGIACANIANLLLARSAARRREIALRLSLGAGRLRIIRQLLTESVLLASFGGVLGVAIAMWGIRFLTVLLANGRENFTLRAELNWHVLAVVAGLSLLTGVLFGLAPALQATREDTLSGLKESRTGQARNGWMRGLSLSRVLIAGQIAVTLLILMTAGLFLRTLSNLGSVQLGFNRENVLTFQLNARQAGHKDPGITALYNDLRSQFAAIPGVLSATLSSHVLIGSGTSGSPVGAGGGETSSSILQVGPDFLATMQIPLLAGRALDERDRAGAPLAAVVNQAFAKGAFGDRSPLGESVTLGSRCPQCRIEIVGVAANTLYGDLKGTAPPTLYLPYMQAAWGPVDGMYFQLRTAGNPLNHAQAVRDLVQRVDPRLPVSDLKTQSARIDYAMGQEITFARLCTAFGALALAIACVGLYGTMSYSVARRTSEIGIRMALGAPRSRVMWLVLRDVVLLAGAGVGISVPIAMASSAALESYLFRMEPNDPMALAGAGAILFAAAILAGYLPASTASRIDPMHALRQE